MKLEVCNITKQFENIEIIHDISLTLKDGELLSLLGTSGVGKSTLFNIISGTMKPDSGSVILDGKDITSTTGHMSYMLQKDMLLPNKTVIDNVCLPLLIKYGHLGTMRNTKRISKKEARCIAAQHFKTFGLEGTEKKYPSQLSGGMNQRAALLRTYLFGGVAALLDEPFSALDAITKQNIHNWYLNIMQKINMPTLFITHDIEEAILLSDRVLVLSGTPGTISSDVPVTLKRPRDYSITMSPEFINYKQHLISLLDKPL